MYFLHKNEAKQNTPKWGKISTKWAKMMKVLDETCYPVFSQKVGRSIQEHHQKCGKTKSSRYPSLTWTLQDNRSLIGRSSRATLWRITDQANYTSLLQTNLKCGLNVLPNHLKAIMNQIEKEWLTLNKEKLYINKDVKKFITTLLSKH